MKYFIYIFICAFLSCCFGFFIKNSKRRALRTALTYFFEKNALPFSRFNLFLSAVIDFTSDFILRQKRHIQAKIFCDLAQNKTQFLIDAAKQKEPLLAAVLTDIFFLQNKKIKIPSANMSPFSKLLYGFFLENTADYKKLEKLLAKMPRFLWQKKYRMLKNFLSARVFFCKTDLKNATKQIVKCLPYFCKKGFTDEAAYCYFMLAETHRTAGLYDMAQMFCTSALKIYEKSENLQGIALLNLAKGVCQTQQGLFETAEESLDKAYMHYKKIQFDVALADVLTQKTILHNQNACFKEAQETAAEALKIYIKHNHESQAVFVLQELAIAHFKTNNYKKALSLLLHAKQKNARLKDRENYAKVLYLLALTYQNTNDLKNAQKTLYDLKKHTKKYRLFFLDAEIKAFENIF